MVMEKNLKLKPYWILGILAFILLTGIIFSMFYVVRANPDAPDPGHTWSEIGNNPGDLIPTDRLGTGTANSSTFLRGDSTWASIPISLDYYNNKLQSDVSIASAGVWYDGPSITLPAGTYLVIGQATIIRGSATAYGVARITTGTTHYASGETNWPNTANFGGTITMATIITLSSETTIKIQVTASAAATLKAAVPTYGSGNNATQITAVKIQ